LGQNLTDEDEDAIAAELDSILVVSSTIRHDNDSNGNSILVVN
jgi:hypothetical protein